MSELYDGAKLVGLSQVQPYVIFISERIMIFLAFHVMKQNINVYACFYNMRLYPCAGAMMFTMNLSRRAKLLYPVGRAKETN